MALLQSSVGVPLLRALLFPILFLAPGLLALRPAQWTARLRDTLSRLQKVVYSVVFSSSSFFLIYFGWSLFRWEPLSPDDKIRFAALVAAVPAHFVITVVVGVVVGSFFHNYVGTARGLDEFDSWEFAFDRYESGKVLVRTESGKEVEGEILEGTEIDRSEGVLLTDPSAADKEDTAAVREKFGDEQETDISRWSAAQRRESERVQLEDTDAQYTYFPREEIETVFFLDEFVEDPNKSQKDQNDRAQSFLSEVYAQLEPSEVEPRPQWWVGAISNSYTLFPVVVLSLVGCVSLLTTAYPFAHAVEIALLGAFGACGTASTVVLHNRREGSEWTLCQFYAGLMSLLFLILTVGSVCQSLATMRGVLVGGLIAPLYVSVDEEYGVIPATYVTILILLVVALSHSVFSDIGSRVTQQFALILLLATVIALGVNRLRVGTAEEFDDWERVTADAVKWLLFGVIAAGIAIPSQLIDSVTVSAVSLGMLLPAAVLGPFAVWRVNKS